MEYGIQMYSLRDITDKDMDLALKSVAEMGYKFVEFAGFFGHPTEKIKAMLDNYGLYCSSTHTGWGEVANNFEETVKYHKTIGNKNIIVPGADLGNQEKIDAFVEMVNKFQPMLAAEGIDFHYHNHSHEFEQDNGKYLMDVLGENTKPEDLKFELDVYWVYRGGVNPIRYMKKYADRLEVFHMKDGNKYDGTPVGYGEVDVEGVLKTAKEIGLAWAVVEAESGTTPERQMEDVRMSAEFLKDKIN